VGVTFLWFLFKSYKFPCLFASIIFARFQAFAATGYQPSRLCHVLLLLCVPAWHLLTPAILGWSGGGESLTSCCFAALWVHTSSNSAPTVCTYPYFFWAFLLNISSPEDGTNTLYQLVGMKEPVPCSDPDEQRGFIVLILEKLSIST